MAVLALQSISSQRLRDTRITMIYEGTNGIQGLDLVGRKLAANGGRAITSFFAEIDAFVQAGGEQPEFTDALARVKAQLQDATLWLMQNGLADPDNAAAASADYLHLFALTGLAYMWALMAQAAGKKIAAGDADPYLADLLAVGRYFIVRVLPDAGAYLSKLKTGAAPVMALAAEAF